jgi:hypothetical protein
MENFDENYYESCKVIIKSELENSGEKMHEYKPKYNEK